MSGIVQTLTSWLFEHTYAVVFIATLVDATAIPFPGRIVLAAAGALAASGDASLTLVIALGAAGVVITDHLWYFAGSLGGDRLLRLYCRLTFSSRECVARTGDWLQRFGPLDILVGRFVAVVRVLAWPPARQHGVGYLTFVAIEVPAALLWTATTATPTPTHRVSDEAWAQRSPRNQPRPTQVAVHSSAAGTSIATKVR